MRKVILAFFVLLAAQAACARRPPKQQSAVEEFTAPAAPGKEEKWVEPEPAEEKKPEPPPPPPEPTSPPPEDGLGYKFGATKNESMRKCSKKGTWSKKGGNYGCSRGLESANIEGKPVLSFCDEKLCAVGTAIVVEGTDFAAWNARFEELKAELVKAHGPPTIESLNIGDECKSDKFVSCLDEGKASAEVTWKWKTGHRVSLTMAKKASGEGPSAIRFVSLTSG